METNNEPHFEDVFIPVDGCDSVPGIWCLPPSAVASVVLAPGGSSDMRNIMLAEIARCLARKRIATLRYNFPYMQRMSRMLDSPATLHKTVAAAVEAAKSRARGVPVFAGGRAFGARTSSVAQSRGVIDGLAGLVFIGFPLHPLSRRSTTAADHLSKVALPMQFIQGTRDASADKDLIEEVVSRLSDRATISWIEGADHSFKLPGEGSRSPNSTAGAIAAVMGEWLLERCDELSAA